MGKKILKLLLYLMAVVGVLIWLDSTEGLTEEGALIEPITKIAHVHLDDLAGYEIAKKKLIDNTSHMYLEQALR